MKYKRYTGRKTKSTILCIVVIAVCIAILCIMEYRDSSREDPIVGECTYVKSNVTHHDDYGVLAIKLHVIIESPVDAATEPLNANGRDGVARGDVISGNITYYDICLDCCGKTDGITASGIGIWNGMDDPHIAACNWLPFGSVVSVNGVEYTIADRGGIGLNEIGRLDIFIPEGHQRALELGRSYADIEIIYINS